MESALHERLAAVVAGRTYRAIAEATATNAETVRRYLQGQSPSVEFLASLCAALGINAEWLLCGRGPMRVEDVKPHALRAASGAELLGAMSTAMETVVNRLDRLEVFVQTLEARMRGRENLATSLATERTDEPPTHPPSGFPDSSPQLPRASNGAGPSPAAADTVRRARRIAGAIAQRSTEDAD